MGVSRTPISCGVHELSGMYPHNFGSYDRSEKGRLAHFEKLVRSLVEYGVNGGIVLFSDHVDYNGRESNENLGHGPVHYGPLFAEFLVQNKLGVCHELPTAINPNTGHTIKVWGWYPDMDAVRKRWETVKKAEREQKERERKAAEAAALAVETTISLADLANPPTITATPHTLGELLEASFSRMRRPQQIPATDRNQERWS